MKTKPDKEIPDETLMRFTKDLVKNVAPELSNRQLHLLMKLQNKGIVDACRRELFSRYEVGDIVRTISGDVAEITKFSSNGKYAYLSNGVCGMWGWKDISE